ncbi:hypothetical protein Hanom_Chr00s095889g01801221 [Helianthus anomalus]
MEFQSNYGLHVTIVASTFFWIGRFIILLNFIVELQNWLLNVSTVKIVLLGKDVGTSLNISTRA